MTLSDVYTCRTSTRIVNRYFVLLAARKLAGCLRKLQRPSAGVRLLFRPQCGFKLSTGVCQLEHLPTRSNGDISALRLLLLGTFALTRGGQSVQLSTRKVQLLLAYLALYPEPHVRDYLAALFWGDTTDEQARHSLRTALHVLRGSVGSEIFLAQRTTVQLNPQFPLWVDARELRRTVLSPVRSGEELREALALYRDDLLAGCYDDWVLHERERYRALYLQGLLALTQELHSQSKYPEACDYAHRVLDCDPLNEQACPHLVFCLIALGQRSEALQPRGCCANYRRNGCCWCSTTVSILSLRAPISLACSSAAWQACKQSSGCR